MTVKKLTQIHKDQELNGERTEPRTLGPEQANILLSGWNYFYWIFGTRVERWTYLNIGVQAENFSLRAGIIDIDIFLRDISDQKHQHRLDFSTLPLYAWTMGETPDKVRESRDMSVFASQFFNKGGGTPSYVKAAIKTYKKAEGLDTHAPAVVNLRAVTARLKALTPEQLKDIDSDEVENLKAILTIV